MSKGLKEISDKLGIPIPNVWVNPLRLACSYEFENSRLGPDYRKAAIKRVLKSRLAFESEGNTQGELVEKLIRVNCPYCRRSMKYSGWGGNSTSYSHGYTCRCGAEITLTFSHDGISIRPKE